MAFEYGDGFYLLHKYWTGQYFSFSSVRGGGRSFCMRTHKDLNPGADEKMLVKNFSIVADMPPQVIEVTGENVCFGDEIFIYSPTHSKYVLGEASSQDGVAWAREAKFTNNRVTFIDPNNPESRQPLGVGGEIEVAIRQVFARPNPINNPKYLTYDNTADGLCFEKEEIKAYERWVLMRLPNSKDDLGVLDPRRYLPS